MFSVKTLSAVELRSYRKLLRIFRAMAFRARFRGWRPGLGSVVSEQGVSRTGFWSGRVVACAVVVVSVVAAGVAVGPPPVSAWPSPFETFEEIVAGGTEFVDGPAAVARVVSPERFAMSKDRSQLIFLDRKSSATRLRRLDLVKRQVSTISADPLLKNATDIAVHHSSGDFFVSASGDDVLTQGKILRITPLGAVSEPFAGKPALKAQPNAIVIRQSDSR